MYFLFRPRSYSHLLNFGIQNRFWISSFVFVQYFMIIHYFFKLFIK